MQHSNYTSLRENTPVLRIKDKAREVIFTTISPVGYVTHLRFKKGHRTDFKVDGMGHDIKTWGMMNESFELEWLADEEDWENVIIMINKGSKVIEKVHSR